MYVGITVQNINHPNYSEKGHYLNVRWQDFAEASGFTLIPLTSVSLADQMIREKYIQAIILSGGGNLSKDFYIVAQNASEDLILTMEVYKKPNDKIIYSRSERHFGVLNFRGN